MMMTIFAKYRTEAEQLAGQLLEDYDLWAVDCEFEVDDVIGDER